MAQAPHFSVGQVGAQSSEGAADVKGVSYHSLQALQRRQNLQMGHLCVLLLFSSSRNLSVQEAEKGSMMLRALSPQLHPFLLLWGCGGESLGVRGPLG